MGIFCTSELFPILRQTCRHRFARLSIQFQQSGSSAFVHGLHRAQLAADGTAAHANEIIQLFVGLAQALLHLGKSLPELVKFGLHRTQQLPYLTGTLLDGKGLEAHLQAVEQRRHGAGAAMFT